MDSLGVGANRPALGLARLPVYYGWVNLTVAALAMVGTLPGRTQGLGLITEPLLKDMQIDRVLFAKINFWATLLGSLLCLGVGRLIDRLGSRAALTGVAVALGAVTLAMSGVRGVLWLALLITLTRGLGQSALSVISLTIVGQWFMRRLSLAMAVYTIILSVGFMIAFPVVGAAVLRGGWRAAHARRLWRLARRRKEAGREIGRSGSRSHVARSSGHARVLDLRFGKFHIWPDRFGHRIVQRIHTRRTGI